MKNPSLQSRGIGTASTSTAPPRAAATRSSGGMKSEWISNARGKYSINQKSADFWLIEYFPRAFEIHSDFMPPLERVAAALGGAVEVEAVPIPRDCSDGFFIALWDRPELHLDPQVRLGSTVWHVMEPDQIARGLAALGADLESGRWDERHGHLREDTPELDLGLRLVVAELG